MEPQPGPTSWALLTMPFLALLAISSVRWVPAGHVLVVTRRGLVSRVTGSGLRLRWPLAGRVEVVEVDDRDLPLHVRATTRDGAEVRLLVLAQVRTLPPTPFERYLDPLASAEVGAQRFLARWVGGVDVADLPDGLLRDWAGLVAAVDAETAPRGVRVSALSLAELDVVLPTTAGHGPR